jgi:hypothetical protein
LATLTVAAAMENYLAKRITKINWHCVKFKHSIGGDDEKSGL